MSNGWARTSVSFVRSTGTMRRVLDVCLFVTVCIAAGCGQDDVGADFTASQARADVADAAPLGSEVPRFNPYLSLHGQARERVRAGL